MAVYAGTAGDDQYAGTETADTVSGGAGGDTLNGGAGSDSLAGEDGADRLDGEDGADTLSGGAGGDTLIVSVGSGSYDVLDGGAGDDRFIVSPQLAAAFPVAYVVTGAGQDTVAAGQGATIVIEDFTPGAGGDVVNVPVVFGVNSAADPFAFGYGRLQQVGADTVLNYISPINRFGFGYYVDLVTFKNTSAASFTSDNFTGPGDNSPARHLTPVEAYDGGVVIGTEFSEVRRAGAGDDTLSGLAGDDLLGGGAGRDVLNGGPGADTLTGGAGADRFVASGGDRITDFSVAEDRIDLSVDPSIHTFAQALNHASLQGGPQDRSTVFYLGSQGGVTVDFTRPEQFQAKNFVYVGGGSGAPDDVNLDGTSDIIWRNTSGVVGPWTLGAQGSAGHVYGVATDGWLSQGTGDFNGDGAVDILWRNGSLFGAWRLNGDVSASGTGVVNRSTDFVVAGVGDLNGDGVTDILWKNGTSVSAWLERPDGIAGTPELGFAAPGWEVQGLGDFNGDGRDDILWRNGSSIGAWTSKADGGVSGRDLITLGTEWRIEGVGDFNRDGIADVLVRNGAQLSYLRGAPLAGSALVALAQVGPGEVLNVGDYDCDGFSDVLWRSGSQVSVAAIDLTGVHWRDLGIADASWSVI